MCEIEKKLISRVNLETKTIKPPLNSEDVNFLLRKLDTSGDPRTSQQIAAEVLIKLARLEGTGSPCEPYFQLFEDQQAWAFL